MLTVEHIIKWLHTAADILEENKEFLTQLDAAIGDGDYGINLNRGFQKVKSQLISIADEDIGAILKTTGMTLLSSVGGASGALYGTLFTRAGAAIAGKYELDTADMAELLNQASSGVMERGKVQAGDKTMVDALLPAKEAFDQAAQGGSSMLEALSRSVTAAEKGMKDSAFLLAKKGRASLLGERSIGHQDPGATSLYLILKALHDTVSHV